jgi:hypothetical protein
MSRFPAIYGKMTAIPRPFKNSVFGFSQNFGILPGKFGAKRNYLKKSDSNQLRSPPKIPCNLSRFQTEYVTKDTRLTHPGNPVTHPVQLQPRNQEGIDIHNTTQMSR